MSKRWLRAVNGPSRPARKAPANTLRLEEFESRCVPSVSLVKDINPNGSSNPYGLIQVGDKAFFFAWESNSEVGLWSTDGTESGTNLIKQLTADPSDNVYPYGRSQNMLNVVGDKLFFEAIEPNAGVELWVSDGTEAGTKLVKDIYPGGRWSNLRRSAVLGNELYFEATSDTGLGLWKTDGTEAGTVLVKHVRSTDNGPYIGDLITADDHVFFSVIGNTDNVGFSELWASDGSDAGTIIVKSFSHIGISDLSTIDGQLYFSGTDSNGTELWRSDGTVSGTHRFALIASGIATPYSSQFVGFNGEIYFTATTISQYSRELWRSDGTQAGTVLVVNLTAGRAESDIGFLTPVGAKLFFTNHLDELWMLDGASGELTMVQQSYYESTWHGPFLYTDLKFTHESVLYFMASPLGERYAVRYYDSITNTLGRIDASSEDFIKLGNRILFNGYDSKSGSELWSFNAPPNVKNDTYVVAKNHSLSISGPGILANDHDMEGDLFTAELLDTPTHGTLLLQGDGSFTYTPEAGFVGVDHFTYCTMDSFDPTNRSGIATVTILVGVPAVPPTISSIPDQLIDAGSQIVIPFTVGDDVTPSGNLTVSIATVDPSIAWNSPVTFGGSHANRTLTLSPHAEELNGLKSFIITVTDEYGLTTVETFNVSVNSEYFLPPPPPLYDIYDPIAASSGSDVIIYKSDGAWNSSLTPFPNQPESVRTASGDFNGDGVLDFVFGTGPGGPSQVKVYDGKTMTMLFFVKPFEASFTGGVNVAVGDVNGDGKAEIAVSPDEGGGPRVRLFNGGNLTPIADFFGIDDPNFRGGARVAIGDMNGDGKGDLVVVAGHGGGPRVAAYDGSQLSSKGGPKLFNDFFAFEKTLRNGIYVAAGDVNGDGFADLVAGGGPGGGSRVLILNGHSLVSNGQLHSPLGNFFVGNPNNRGGIRVAVKDLDGDDRADIVTGAGPGISSNIAAYYGKNIFLIGTPQTAFGFDAFPGQTSGVFVG